MALPNDLEDVTNLEAILNVSPIVAGAVREIMRVGSHLRLMPGTESKHRPTYLVSRRRYVNALEQFLEKVPGMRREPANLGGVQAHEAAYRTSRTKPPSLRTHRKGSP